ncbi:DNA (cytosine-5-)-methyltransferase [Mycoplasmopsis gallinacea]|uniref:DNA (cytosine-5-)-methyltransferase n=1 Tax=Mycoplasmopsis gallinacea TaxID=29556 RepID=A0A6H0V3F7_9BACT|nr:DNA (cytosine-5-)-methyltransferase [Mycoplasmopsis gallinacea]QIW62006.1 DNA (cytosine-5-)-methyltransferase [Mycoplasmopsis gallinacea]
MKFKILDLFAGAGGFSTGIEKIKNFETMVAVDFDKNALETFKHNHPKAKTILGDITDEKIKEEIINSSKQHKVNMIIGGPPCQGFSLKGKQLGLEDPRNFLFLEYIDLVERIKPEVFVIENVKALLSAANGYFINEIVSRMEKLGYIVNFGSINAKDFGVPQNRERTIIIGSLSKSINLPVKTVEKITTVRDAISDLAYLSSGEGEKETEYLNEGETQYQLLMRGEKLYNHIATKHSDLAIEKLKMIPPEGDKSHLPTHLHGKQKFKTTWSRLKWDTISPTIDTRFDTPSNGRNSHPFLNRAITPREAARIQSFPDSYLFLGNKTSICKQIGNAVPPLMAKEIGATIQRAYKNEVLTNKDWKIYNADAYTIIKELKNDGLKVDHIITDPPYNISKENSFHTLTSGKRKGIHFGEWDENFDLTAWIKSYTELLKPNGSIIIFCSYLYISYLIDELIKNNIVVKDVLVWKKTNPMPRNVDRRYVQDKEFAIWGVKKGAKWIFNKPKETPYLRSEFITGVVSGKERTFHPTQKSLTLMNEIIKIHTNEGDVIIDPFMGSGTTGVASLRLNRSFIGVEKDQKYFELARERILNEHN